MWYVHWVQPVDRNVVGNVCGMYTGCNLYIEMWWELYVVCTLGITCA